MADVCPADTPDGKRDRGIVPPMYETAELVSAVLRATSLC